MAEAQYKEVNGQTNRPSDDDSDEEKVKNISTAPQKIDEDQGKNACWLSVDLRLDSYSVKEELFTITGWINLHWKWTNDPPKLAQELMSMEIYDDAFQQKYNIYQNDAGQHIVEIIDLRDTEITSFLPINSNKVFYQSSLDSIDHIDPPHLKYNKQTKIFHTQFYVRASLLEDLELLTFPFDRQFLNLKLRFKFDKFLLVNYKDKKMVENFWEQNKKFVCHCIKEDEKKVKQVLGDLHEKYFYKFLFHGIKNMELVLSLHLHDLKEMDVKLGDRKKIMQNIQNMQNKNRTDNMHEKQILKQKNDEETKDEEAKLTKKLIEEREEKLKNEKKMYYDNPVKIRLKETLMDEVTLHDAWVRFDLNKTHQLKFALIRIRVVRNPVYTLSNVIMPFFIIVAASFSQFFIEPDEIGDRLGVAIGILLTFAAFQGAIGEEIPESGEMLLIDWYISSAYVIQALLIWEACLVSVEDDKISHSVKHLIDLWFGIVLAVIWVVISFGYVSMWSKKIRGFYGKCFINCCGWCSNRIGWTNWKERGEEEIERWKENETEFSRYDDNESK